MENKFDVGNVVRLNSGGPLMTFVKLNTREEMIKYGEFRHVFVNYRCQWFDEKNNLHTEDFAEEILSV